MDIWSKSAGIIEFHVFGSNGDRNIFLKYGNEWSHAFGTIDAGVRESILDALILRYEYGAVKTFLYRGKRQIVCVSWVHGGGEWSVMINNRQHGSIAFYENEGFRWWISSQDTWLKQRHMEYFIRLIKSGRIDSPEPLRKRIGNFAP